MKNFGIPFKQKLIQTRIEGAKGFLKSTDLSIEKISEKVGFGSTEYFYHSFKQNTGITPNEYRNDRKKI